MSYNNNFSYFNAPATSNEWWGSKDAKKSNNFDDNRVVKIDYNNQPYAQNYMQNYTQSMILPSENRPIEPVHPRHEVLQGTVTQLFASFGYINDNIIFSKTDVSGPMVKVGDRVAVDATYQPNNPTKYKGERVCKIDDSRFSSTSNSLSKMKPLSRDLSSRIDIPLTYSAKNDKKSELKPDKIYEKKPKPIRRSSEPKENKKPETKKHGKLSTGVISPIDLTKSEKFDKSVKDSSVSSLKRKTRSSSKNHKTSTKTAPESDKKSSSSSSKITVEKLPKSPESFALRELDCAALKFRYKNIQPPNQFFHVSLKYQQTFPLNHPMKLGNACHFKVLDRKVKSIDNYINEQLNRDIDPEDADTTFSAKVMLLSTDELAEFYKQTLILTEEFDSNNKVPITKAIKFLVGNTGPNKEFAFGGAWSPSLDGPDPDTNPRVLINTAIRTCKNLTGIDLSGCSSWPKFLELHYYRPLQKIQRKTADRQDAAKSDNKTESESEERFEYIEPRMETVVYYVPDIWNCVPSQESWNDIKRMYQEQLTSLMCPPPSIPGPAKPAASINKTAANQNLDEATATKKPTSNDIQEEEDYNFNENEEIDEKSKDSEPVATDEVPTHYGSLNVDGMKIIEIKKELELRKLSAKGVMEQLKARLKSALEKEEMEEKVKDPTSITKTVPEVKSVSEHVLSETDKKELKLLYSLPDNPHIIVHHNHKHQDSKMRIKTMSLHSLLGYYDVKFDETTFEVALFARQFLEMLRRDAVFNVYKSLVVTPESDLVSKEEDPRRASLGGRSLKHSPFRTYSSINFTPDSITVTACNKRLNDNLEKNPAKKPKLMVTTSKRTVNRPLLFSCTILDRERTNKIQLDDLKGLIEGLGICLSSDQLSALINKVKETSKCLNYRVLTDKEIDDNDMSTMLITDQTDDLDYIRELAMGNKALFDDGIAVDCSVDMEEIDRLKNELDKSERCRQTLELRFAEIREEAGKSTQLIQSQLKEIEKYKEQISDYRTKYHHEQDRGDFYKKDFDKIYRDLKEIDKLSAGLGKYIVESVERYKKIDKPAEKGDKVEKSVDKTPAKAAPKPVASHGKSKQKEVAKASNNKPNSSAAVTNNQLAETSENLVEEITILSETPSEIIDELPLDVEMSDSVTIEPESGCNQEKEEDMITNEEKPDNNTPQDHKEEEEVTSESINQGHEDFELSKPSDYEIIILDETE